VSFEPGILGETAGTDIQPTIILVAAAKNLERAVKKGAEAPFHYRELNCRRITPTRSSTGLVSLYD